MALDNAKLHREMAQNMERFQQLANSISQLAWMAKPDGFIFWYNQALVRLHRRTTAESQKGWGWESLHDPKELPRLREKWKAALANGEPWEDTFALHQTLMGCFARTCPRAFHSPSAMLQEISFSGLAPIPMSLNNRIW